MPGNNASGNRSGAPKPITAEDMRKFIEALRNERNRQEAVNGVADVAETDVTLFALAWAAGRTWEDILNLRTWSIRPQANGDVVVYWCKFKSPKNIKYYHPYMYTLFTGSFARELVTLRDRRGGGNYPHTLTDLTCDNVNKLLKSAVLGVHEHGYTHDSLRAGALLQAEKLADKHLGDLPQAKKERMLCVLRQKPHKSFPAKSTVQAIEDATAYLTRSDVLSQLLLDSISYSPATAPSGGSAPAPGAGAVSAQHKEGHAPAVPAEKDPEEREAATPMTAEHLVRFIEELQNGTKEVSECDLALLVLAWITASSWGDICDLTTDSIRPQENGEVEFVSGTATKKDTEEPSWPYNKFVVTGKLANWLKKLKEEREAESGGNGAAPRLATLTTDGLRSLLAAEAATFGGQHYTGQSIKRGALQTAARLADRHGIEPKMVSFLAKHKHDLLDKEYSDLSEADKTKPFPGSHELPRLLLEELNRFSSDASQGPATALFSRLREERSGDGIVFITAGGRRLDSSALRKADGEPYAESTLRQRARLLQRFEDFCKAKGLEVEASNIEAFIASLDVSASSAKSYRSDLEAALS